MTGSIPPNTPPVKADSTISSQAAANKIGDFNVSEDGKFAYQPFTVEVEGVKYNFTFTVGFPGDTNTKVEKENFLKQYTKEKIEIGGKMAVSTSLKDDEVLYVNYKEEGKINKSVVRKRSQGNRIKSTKIENYIEEIRKLESSKNKDNLERLNILNDQLKLFKKMQHISAHRFDEQLSEVPQFKKTQAMEEAVSAKTDFTKPKPYQRKLLLVIKNFGSCEMTGFFYEENLFKFF